MAEHRLFPYFLIVTAGVIWGGTFSLALIATAEGAHPLALSAWQVVLTGAFFGLAILIVAKNWLDARPHAKQETIEPVPGTV